MEKTLGFVLQSVAACLFFVAGLGAAPTDGAALLLLAPATLTGIGGLALWSRGWGKPLPEPVHTPTSPQPRPQAITDDQIVRLQEALVALQEDVSKLREDRDFFQKLYQNDRLPTTTLASLPPR